MAAYSSCFLVSSQLKANGRLRLWNPETENIVPQLCETGEGGFRIEILAVAPPREIEINLSFMSSLKFSSNLYATEVFLLCMVPLRASSLCTAWNINEETWSWLTIMREREREKRKRFYPYKKNVKAVSQMLRENPIFHCMSIQAAVIGPAWGAASQAAYPGWFSRRLEGRGTRVWDLFGLSLSAPPSSELLR